MSYQVVLDGLIRLGRMLSCQIIGYTELKLTTLNTTVLQYMFSFCLSCFRAVLIHFKITLKVCGVG